MMACGVHALEDLPYRVLVHLRLLVSTLHVRQLPYENLAPHPLPFLLARQARRDVHRPKLLAAIPKLRGIGGELVQQRILPFRQVRTLEVVQKRVAVVVEHLVLQAVGYLRLELQLAHVVASLAKVLLHGFERIAPEDVDDLRPAVCGLELQRLGVPRHAARSQPGTKHPSHGQDAKRCTCLGKLFAHSSMAFMDKSLDCCKSWRRRGALPPSPCNALRMLSFAC